MKRLRIGILDLVARAPSTALWSRIMNPNFASVMPQAIGVWCEQDGHDVHYVCYTGAEVLSDVLPKDIDVLFIGAFTEAAQLSYAISALFRARGAITVLGGPHARCYPEDAARFFDYVLGFTDHELVRDVIRERARHRPVGTHMAATKQPTQLPGAQARWKYIAPTLEKAKMFKLVPMIASLGCPYTCSFCIDSTVDYQAMSYDQLATDLRFLRTVMDKPRVGWQDPNFGVRFDEMLGVIEEAVPPGSVHFVAESSLSLLSEPRLQRLQKNGFLAMLPGVESWFSLGNKSRTGHTFGEDKVRQVAEHVNMILRYIPYVQANFVFGLDCDEGSEPFRADEEIRGSRAGCVSRIFAAHRVRSGGAAQPRVPARRARAVVPASLSGQPRRDERAAEELHVAGVLREHDRSHPPLLLDAHRGAPADGEPAGHPTHAERDPCLCG